MEQHLENIFKKKMGVRNEISQKVFLGKADAEGRGRRINALELEIRLHRRDDGAYIFSASGDVWNAKHTDIVTGGQCVDDVAAMVTHPESKKIADFIQDMWKKYHLNDMHAGTPRQEAIIREGVAKGELESGSANNYENVCKYLEEKGVLTDEEYRTEKYPGGYTYGHGWLTQEIPEKDLNYIAEFILFNRVPEAYLEEQESLKESEEERELEDR